MKKAKIYLFILVLALFLGAMHKVSRDPWGPEFLQWSWPSVIIVSLIAVAVCWYKYRDEIDQEIEDDEDADE